MSEYTKAEDIYDNVGITQDGKYVVKGIPNGYLCIPIKDAASLMVREICKESMWEITTYILKAKISRYQKKFPPRRYPSSIEGYRGRWLFYNIVPKSPILGSWDKIYFLEENPDEYYILESTCGKLIFEKTPIDHMRKNSGELPDVAIRSFSGVYIINTPGKYTLDRNENLRRL